MERFGMLLFLITLIGVAVVFVKKSGVLPKNFDERQERARGKAYQLAFYNVLVWLTLLYLVSLGQNPQVSIHFFYCSTFFVGAVSWLVPVIWSDAYFNWKDRGNHWGSILYHLVMVFFTSQQLLKDQAKQGVGWLTYVVEEDGAMVFFNAAFFLLLFLLFLAKWLWEKRKGDHN